jgi:hypothetical protein
LIDKSLETVIAGGEPSLTTVGGPAVAPTERDSTSIEILQVWRRLDESVEMRMSI